jgi:hypothetical protein
MCNLNLMFHSCSDLIFLLNEESHKITRLSDAIIYEREDQWISLSQLVLLLSQLTPRLSQLSCSFSQLGLLLSQLGYSLSQLSSFITTRLLFFTTHAPFITTQLLFGTTHAPFITTRLPFITTHPCSLDSSPKYTKKLGCIPQLFKRVLFFHFKPI